MMERRKIVTACRLRRAIGLADALLFCTAIPNGAWASAQQGVSVTLQPQLAGRGTGSSGIIGVTIAVTGHETTTGKPIFEIPLLADNVDALADTMTGLTIADASGPLPVRAIDTVSVDGTPIRQWLAGRATHGDVIARYTVPAHAVLPPRGPAPPLAAMSEGAAFSAAGQVFLLTPADGGAYRYAVDWNLRQLPAGSRGVSSLGEGHVVSASPMTTDEINRTFYMAGKIGVWPDPTPRTGFFSAWQGKPAVDPVALMSWTGALYTHVSTFFGLKSPPPYGVFFRHNPINAGGGVALTHSFVATYGAGYGSSITKLKATLSHEMFHTFQPTFATDGNWFNEGSAVYYQMRLPARFGMVDTQTFIDDINFYAARYYTNALGGMPNRDLAPGFWKDTRIRTLPYDRGMLYLAAVDSAVRKASHGSRNLDDLLMQMLRVQRETGRPLTNADWRHAVLAAIGTAGAEAFDRFLQGETPVPGADAFGPCFTRISVPLRRYEVGFDPAVLGEPKRIVRGLVAGSAAQRAGLRNGDRIMYPVPQDAIQGDQTAMLDLTIERDGQVFDISYLPRGETVMAFQWRKKRVAADNCDL